MLFRSRKIGVCHLINNLPDNEPSAENSLGVVGAADDYLTKYEHKKSLFGERKIEGVGLVPVTLGTSTTRVLQQPSNGRLIFEADTYRGASEETEDIYSYIPEDGYFGKDRAVFLVDINGQKVKVIYYFQVMDHPIGNTGYEDLCKKGYEWKISATTPDGTPIFSNEDTAVSSAGTYTQAPSPLLGNYSNSDSPNITYSFTNLPGTAVGQTTGEGTAANILLDTNAAGRGWFMDNTPLSNNEYLPTSNPNEWIAKAGSAAADKMDLLSVLLHEYGHALGFAHSSDPYDFMGTSLTAGVRRLPTADEMQLMANLIGEMRTQNQRHSALDAESRTSFDEIAGLARNDKLLNDKLYSSRRLG